MMVTQNISKIKLFLKKIASCLPFTMTYDESNRERVMTSLVCTFPDKEFTEIDQVCAWFLKKNIFVYIGLFLSNQNKAI